MQVVRSQYERQYGLPVLRILRLELVTVPLVGLQTPPAQEYDGEQGEPHTGGGLDHESEAKPLDNFSEIVWTGDKSEHPTVRNLVASLPLLPQALENVVRLNVDKHSTHEDASTKQTEPGLELLNTENADDEVRLHESVVESEEEC